MSTDGPATRLHPREIAKAECFPKPGLAAAPKGATEPVLEVYPRTDLHFCIFDHRRPWNDQVIFLTQARGLRRDGDAFREVRFVLEYMAAAEGFELLIAGVL